MNLRINSVAADTATTDADQALEDRIDAQLLRLQTATTYKQRHAAWVRTQRLIAQRSAAQIARMERERGLR